MNKYNGKLIGQKDPSIISGGNPMDNNGFGGQSYRPYVTGGSKLRPTGVGPYCWYTSKDGADKASECKTFEVRYIKHTITHK